MKHEQQNWNFLTSFSKKKTIVNLDVDVLLVVHVLNVLLFLLSTYFSNVDNPFAKNNSYFQTFPFSPTLKLKKAQSPTFAMICK
jgi:hypothetical protein